MLQLQIGFPSGRYLAADLSDPRQPEWPPHPSRVYSALVAAAYAGGRQPTESERAALVRLEGAAAPSLCCPEADLRQGADTYVPVNDTKSRIDARPVNGKLKSHGVLLGNRQVRQFPSAFILDQPEVRLIWPFDLDPPTLHDLDGLAARVTHIGTSHSYVVARFVQGADAPPPTWVPHGAGERFLRVPRAGRLDELDRLAHQGYGTVRRPPPACETLQPYGQAGSAADAEWSSGYEWVALRLSELSWGADTAVTLARATRAAVMSLLADAAPAAVHGHDPQVPHLAWLPLPDVGHAFARGRIRGIGVALPRSMPAQDRALALAALARLQTVRLPDGQVARVAPSIDGPETPVVLRSDTWCAASTRWSTVTPVLLDRPPKRGRGAAQILAAVADSIVNAGFPDPVAIHATELSDFEGAPGVRDIPTRVPRFHARVTFALPVRGPVLAGRWRNFGIGLFRPTPARLSA